MQGVHRSTRVSWGLGGVCCFGCGWAVTHGLLFILGVAWEAPWVSVAARFFRLHKEQP